MQDVLAGIRVVEVAAWTFVPISGAVLAEWGADVIKIEHPQTGDPQRGLVSSGLVPGGGDVNFMIEIPNRGKRSVALDISTDAGRELSPLSVVRPAVAPSKNPFALISPASHIKSPMRCGPNIE